MENFRKVVRLGTKKTWGGRGYSVFCEIVYKDGRLSITGVEGPMPGGNCLGGCGQINMDGRLLKGWSTFAPGWEWTTIAQFSALWDLWPLNDMVAGTPDQEHVVRQVTKVIDSYPEHYEALCAILDQCDLYRDKNYDMDGHLLTVEERTACEEARKEYGYVYGSKWLRKEVPEEVLRWLSELPDADKQPAWV